MKALVLLVATLLAGFVIEDELRTSLADWQMQRQAVLDQIDKDYYYVSEK